jgi:hypothetical protein
MIAYDLSILYQYSIHREAAVNQIEINQRSGGLSEVARKKLARELTTSEQTLSSVIKRLISPHIHLDLLECEGVFTTLGLEFMRRLFAIVPSNGDALGQLRKRFILQGATSEEFQTLYKSWNPPEPEVDFVIELPQPEAPSLDGTIETYHQATLAIVEDECPNFLEPVESPSMTRFQEGMYSLFYRRFRAMGSAVVSGAFSDAMHDTLTEAEAGLGFQMGQQ